MVKSISILAPAGIETYTEGESECVNINIHFNFANVVYVKIFFSDKSTKQFYQCPCVYTYVP